MADEVFLPILWGSTLIILVGVTMLFPERLFRWWVRHAMDPEDVYMKDAAKTQFGFAGAAAFLGGLLLLAIGGLNAI